MLEVCFPILIVPGIELILNRLENRQNKTMTTTMMGSGFLTHFQDRSYVLDHIFRHVQRFIA